MIYLAKAGETPLFALQLIQCIALYFLNDNLYYGIIIYKGGGIWLR